MPVTKTEPGYSTEQIENDLATARGQVDALSEYAEMTTLVVAGTVVAQQPGTSTEPMTQEDWHSFSPLSNSWTVPGAGGFAKYRITPSNELQISALINAPSSSVNSVTICTFPVGYQPVSTHGFPVGCSNALLGSSAPGPYMTVTSAGVMQSIGVGGNANCYIEVRIPLDV